MFIDSQYSADTINKLFDAYSKGKIDVDDLFLAVKYTTYKPKNEPYVDEYLKSIDNGFSHTTATQTFSACLFEHCTYKEAMNYVKSGAFYPTEYSSLSVTNDVAYQLDKMGVSLRACEGFNYCYDVDDLKEALDREAAIFVQDKDVALKVCEYMKLPDWSSFRSKVEYEMGSDIANLSGSQLNDLRIKFTVDTRGRALYDKVQAEYISFVNEMKQAPPEEIIESAYDIVIRDNIVTYCDEYYPELSSEQFEALMSRKNTLDEIYEVWCKNGDLHSIYDVGIAIVETADRIQISLNRDQQKNIAVETAELQHETDDSLDTAKEMINNFCQSEYGSIADFSDLHNVGIAYTTLTDDEIPIQVSVDLIDCKIIYELDGKIFKVEQYNSIKEMTDNALSCLSFDDLISVPDIDSVLEALT